MWASALPSACLKPPSLGMYLLKRSIMSRFTSGSQPSLIVTPQVVWGL